MMPKITVDKSRFDRAWSRYVLLTGRSMADVVNSRTFFLMLRLYCLLPPKSPQAARNKILDYFNRPVGARKKDKKTGKFLGRSRELRLVHLIVQSKNFKAGNEGLYGPTMRAAAASLRRRAAGSVGYLKSCVVKAIKKLSPSFQQFGGTRRVRKGSAGVKIVAGNQALINLANQYGLPQENVSVHRGSSAYAYKAKTGQHTYSMVKMNLGLADNQMGKVASIYAKAMNQAYNDEAKELEDHIKAKLEEVSGVLEENGITVQ